MSKIADFNNLFTLLLKRDLNIEQKVLLLELTYTTDKIYSTDKTSEIIPRIDLSLANLIQQAYTSSEQQFRLLFLGLSVQKLISDSSFEWDKIITGVQIGGAYLTKNDIIQTYIDFCIETEEIDKLYNLLRHFLINTQISFENYIKLLRICLNLHLYDKVNQFIDDYARNLLLKYNVKLSKSSEKKLHEYLLNEDIPPEFEALKLVVMEILYETHSNDEIKAMTNLNGKWKIPALIEEAVNNKTLNGFPISLYIATLSINYNSIRLNQSDIDDVEFYMQNLKEEEIFIIFSPYFVKWIKENEGSQRALQFLQNWLANTRFRQNYRLTYEKILILLKDWDLPNQARYIHLIEEIHKQIEELVESISPKKILETSDQMPNEDEDWDRDEDGYVNDPNKE